MKKEDYLSKISEQYNVPKNLCDKIIDAYLDELRLSITKRDKVIITNIGTFTKTLIKPKVIFSPIDGSALKSKSYFRITFTCSKKLIDSLKDYS